MEDTPVPMAMHAGVVMANKHAIKNAERDFKPAYKIPTSEKHIVRYDHYTKQGIDISIIEKKICSNL